MLTLFAHSHPMRLAFLAPLWLAACNTPGLDFAGQPATQVTVAGSTFAIRIADRRAEAIRLNPGYAPRLGPIGARAAFAMEQVSGCKVTKIKGDAAVVYGTLRCSGEAAPLQGVLPRGTLECYGIDSYESAATGELITNYDCDWLPD